MSASIDDIWAEPLDDTSPTRKRPQGDAVDEPSPKRPRPALFFQSSDDEGEHADAGAAASKADIDAHFEGLDENTQVGETTLPPTSGSVPKAGEKKGDDDVVPGKRVMPKMDATRLLGENGLPALIKQCKNFKPKGKGHELHDLNRLFSIYQFWAHKMFPKIQFNDVVERVEKLCHSRRLHVAMSVYRDEVNRTVNGISLDGLTEEGDADAQDGSTVQTGDLGQPTADTQVGSSSAALDPPKPTEGAVMDEDAVWDDIMDSLAAYENTTLMEAGKEMPPAREKDDLDEMWDIADDLDESPPETAQQDQRGKDPPVDKEKEVVATNDSDWDDMYA